MASKRPAKPAKRRIPLKSRAKNRAFSPKGFIVVRPNNEVVLTESAAHMLSLNAAEPGGVRLDDLPPGLQSLIAQSRGRPKKLHERTVDLSIEDKLLSLQLIAWSSPAGRRKPEVTLFLQDAKVLRRNEDQLRQLDRLAALGTLAAGIAHEIKNALVVGKTFFDLLLEKHREEELVDLVRHELSRIERLVSQMLRFTSSSKTGFAEIHLHEVLNHSLRLVQRQLEDKAIQVECLYRADFDLVQGDESQLEQAFVNLLLNAIEAMGPRGHLTVGTEKDVRNRLLITFQDTGTGIAPENMDRLFAPFFSTKSGGTGLGLSITQGIIQQHGGAIKATSKLAEGAEFLVDLPLKAQQEIRERAPLSQAVSANPASP